MSNTQNWCVFRYIIKAVSVEIIRLLCFSQDKKKKQYRNELQSGTVGTVLASQSSREGLLLSPGIIIVVYYFVLQIKDISFNIRLILVPLG